MLNFMKSIFKKEIEAGNSGNELPVVSLLLGSGFSKADGLPLVGEINKRMRSIKEGDIMIHSDGTAFFLNGQINFNEWLRKNERLFVQEFLKFYCKDVIGGEESFHYETFFDYYSGYLNETYTEDNLINAFCDKFRIEYDSKYDELSDNYNLVKRFHNTFNQLIATGLHRAKHYEDVANINYPPYDNFIGFLSHLMKDNQVKVHTLNHDVLFEKVGRVGSLWQEFSDGYLEENSSYYSDVKINNNQINKKYRVRLKSFQNKFDTKLCLFKLHGSIDTYQFNIASQNNDLTRVKLDYGVEPRFVKEVKDSLTGKFRYEKGWQLNYPDFLSGTTTKMLSYGNEFYSLIFNHFKQNLENSKLLIVVGYGFGDPGIDKYLKDYFLEKGGKMVVVTPHKPQSELINYPETLVIEKRMEQVTLNEYISAIAGTTLTT